MSIIKISQNEQDECLLELDLNPIDISPGKLMEEISKLKAIHILEWNQYTECAIGKISFSGETISILWEDFPNKIDFYSKSKDTLSALEYELRKLLK